MTEKNAAVLGLGIIGSRAFSRLSQAGWQVNAWNRTPKGLAGETGTPAEAIHGAAIISLYLKDVAAVRAVMGGLGAHLVPGQIVLNHSTIDLETTLWLAAICQDHGCRFLDAPFTGSRDASATGKLFYYLGGDASLIEEVTPYLMVTGRDLLVCGGVGDATVLKLSMNLVSACVVQGIAEAMAITTGQGIAKEVFAKAAADSAFASPLAAMKIPGMLAGDYETHFSLSNMWKDSRYALDLAAQARLEVPAITAVSRRMKELSDSGMADLDFSSLAKPYLDPA
jgi:3-hydroxyisobutyrate dehydrogenase/glyoxylate/succinic semialdehyde reductase